MIVISWVSTQQSLTFPPQPPPSFPTSFPNFPPPRPSPSPSQQQTSSPGNILSSLLPPPGLSSLSQVSFQVRHVQIFRSSPGETSRARHSPLQSGGGWCCSPGQEETGEAPGLPALQTDQFRRGGGAVPLTSRQTCQTAGQAPGPRLSSLRPLQHHLHPPAGALLPALRPPAGE